MKSEWAFFFLVTAACCTQNPRTSRRRWSASSVRSRCASVYRQRHARPRTNERKDEYVLEARALFPREIMSKWMEESYAGKKKNERKGGEERALKRKREKRETECVLLYKRTFSSRNLSRSRSTFFLFYPSSVLLYVLLTLEPLFLLLVRSLTGLNNLFFVEKV